MSYIDAINYLYGLQKHGIKLGLDKPEKILLELGNPHRKFLSIHVAGTNGKGSVSAMIASILIAKGFKVGLFTSPHLVSFTERIRINNEEIAESEVVKLTEEIKFKIKNSKLKIPEPTFFEFVTAMAFLYFARNNVDWAVIEVGMGGRLDATNVIEPEVSVITWISYDHQEFLGNTLSDIAREKAGIIKSGIPVVSTKQEKEAEDVISTVAKEKSSPLYLYGRDFEAILRSSDIKGVAFDFQDKGSTIDNNPIRGLFVPLAGDYQYLNASLAIKAAMVALSRNPKFEMPNSKLIGEGLSNTKWPGRLEMVCYEPMIMIDGAHNPDAAGKLADFVKKQLRDFKIILIIGVMSDKDVSGILKPLLPVAHEIIFTAPNYGRAASPKKLAEYAENMGFASRITSSVKEAIEIAKNRALEQNDIRAEGKKSGFILITGSFYTIGEAMEALGKRPILGTLRETV